MASFPQQAPQGAQPQQGSAPLPPPGQVQGGGGASSGPQVIQLMQIIAAASQKLQSSFPAASPMVSEIQKQLEQIQSKVTETQRPTQPQAPPI